LHAWNFIVEVEKNIIDLEKDLTDKEQELLSFTKQLKNIDETLDIKQTNKILIITKLMIYTISIIL